MAARRRKSDWGENLGDWNSARSNVTSPERSCITLHGTYNVDLKWVNMRDYKIVFGRGPKFGTYIVWVPTLSIICESFTAIGDIAPQCARKNRAVKYTPAGNHRSGRPNNKYRYLEYRARHIRPGASRRRTGHCLATLTRWDWARLSMVPSRRRSANRCAVLGTRTSLTRPCWPVGTAHNSRHPILPDTGCRSRICDICHLKMYARNAICVSFAYSVSVYNWIQGFLNNCLELHKDRGQKGRKFEAKGRGREVGFSGKGNAPLHTSQWIWGAL